MALAAGQTLAHYRIIAAVGAGGMGEVYRAHDSKLNREVAIKVLPELFAADAERLARFTREAQTLASLNHPNIAAIYGVEESGNVRALVMELVAGDDLSVIIARGPIPLAEALPIARQIAEALEAAHEQVIVHRDLKPANVKVRDDGTVKVLDFGLAKALEPPSASGLRSSGLSQSPTMAHAGTQAGMILGTAAYMAPEQARGKAVDKRADIWAFGVVLYEMLTGKRAFAGESTSDVLAAVLRQDIDWGALPAGTPPQLRRLLERCLDRDVKQRLRDIGEARVVLSGGNQTEPSLATPGGRRVGALAIVMAALVLAALASGVTWLAARRAAPGATEMPIAVDLTRVTADSGLTTDPTVSPTGSLLAYASDRGSASLNIWVQPLPTGQPVQVTRGDTDAHEPSFSPDGSRIVFRSERDGGGIYVVPALGGAERLISPRAQEPAFSPDGKRIAYTMGGRGSGTELWVVDEAGGVPTRLAADLRGASRPVWSPDGAAVAVVGRLEAPDTADWYRVDVATGSVTPMRAATLLKTAGVALSAPGVWLPGEIVFSARSGDSESLWSIGVSVDGRTVTAPVRRLTAGTSLDRSPTVATGSGGRRLYFASLDQRANLYRLPIALNAGRPSGDPQPLTDAAAEDAWPTISADGRFVVFASNRQSGASAWLQNLDSLETTLLGTVESRLVNISPEGRRVIYKTRVQGQSRFVVRPVGGGAAQPIPLDLFWVWDWPAESWLITGGVVGADRQKLYAFDFATGKLRPLLSGESGQTYGHGRLAPDGRWVSAMEWTVAGRSRIVVFPFRDAPVPASELVIVTDEDSVAEEHAWSPDGQLLYFVSERDGNRCLWVRRLDPVTKHPAGPPAAVLHLHGSRRSMIATGGMPARFAVGRNELIFSMELKRGNIWTVTLKEP